MKIKITSPGVMKALFWMILYGGAYWGYDYLRKGKSDNGILFCLSVGSIILVGLITIINGGELIENLVRGHITLFKPIEFEIGKTEKQREIDRLLIELGKAAMRDDTAREENLLRQLDKLGYNK